jgi:serine/threonine protein kinase
LIKSFDVPNGRFSYDDLADGTVGIVAASKSQLTVKHTKTDFTENSGYSKVRNLAINALIDYCDGRHEAASRVSSGAEIQWLKCMNPRCGKWRIVSFDYMKQYEGIARWTCDQQDSPLCKRAKELGLAYPCSVKEDLPEGMDSESQFEAKPEDYRIITKGNTKQKKKIGQGNQGTVYDGSYLGGVRVAIKVFHEKVDRASLDAQIAVMKRVTGHRNIVCLRFYDPTAEPGPAIGFEFIEGVVRTLQQLLEAKDTNLNEVQLNEVQKFNIAVQIASGMVHIHEIGRAAHYDLKPANILCSEVSLHGSSTRGGYDTVVEIADFGLARLEKHDSSQHSVQHHGTARYKAPDSYKQDLRGPKGDVWSFGILLVDLFCTSDGGAWGKQTMPADKCCDLVCSGKSPADFLPGLISLRSSSESYLKALCKLAEQCLAFNPNDRPDCVDIEKQLSRMMLRIPFEVEHGTTFVYHAVEPGDKLELDESGQSVVSLTRHMPSAKPRLLDHIMNGSAPDYQSQFISCSLDFCYAAYYAQKEHKEGILDKPMLLELDVSKLGKHVKCMDISSRARYYQVVEDMPNDLSKGPMAENFASCAKEVVLDVLAGAVPVEAIVGVWNLFPSESVKKNSGSTVTVLPRSYSRSTASKRATRTIRCFGPGRRKWKTLALLIFWISSKKSQRSIYLLWRNLVPLERLHRRRVSSDRDRPRSAPPEDSEGPFQKAQPRRVTRPSSTLSLPFGDVALRWALTSITAA